MTLAAAFDHKDEYLAGLDLHILTFEASSQDELRSKIEEHQACGWSVHSVVFVHSVVPRGNKHRWWDVTMTCPLEEEEA